MKILAVGIGGLSIALAVSLPVQATGLSEWDGAATTRDKVSILDYIEDLPGYEDGGFSIRYVNEPLNDGRRTELNNDGTASWDSKGAAGWIGEPDYEGNRYELRYFTDYNYERQVSPLTAETTLWSPNVTQTQNTPVGLIEGVILYFTGTDDYPQDSMGTVTGQSVVWSAEIEVYEQQGWASTTLKTTCLREPVAGEPLCRVYLGASLNAQIFYGAGAERIERPEVQRVLPLGYNPVTNRYKGKKSLRVASKKAVPRLAKVRREFGKSVRYYSVPYASVSPAAISILHGFNTRTAEVSRMTFSNPRDANLFILADAPEGGKFTYVSANKAVIVTVPGLTGAIAYVAHKGMLVKVTAQDKKKARKLLRLLR